MPVFKEIKKRFNSLSSSQKLSPAQIAVILKGKCVDYVMENLEDDFWESGFRQNISGENRDGGESDDIQDWVLEMDNFILFGKVLGKRVLDEIIVKAKLTNTQKDVLKQWRDNAFPSVFEIKEVASDNIKAMDVLAEVDYQIYVNDLEKTGEIIKNMPIGSFVYTNIAPIKNVWFFSGIQNVLPKESEEIIFKICVSTASTRQIFRNNQKKLEWALKTQKEHRQIFIDTFGTDEIIVPVEQTQETLQKYYNKLVERFGASEKFTAPKLPEDFRDFETMGIIMDEHEGQHEFGDYGRFVEIFQNGDISKKSCEFIMDYLEDETTPTFIFKRMKEKYPENFYKVLLETTMRADRCVYPIDDFDTFMDIFKPGWRERYPSVFPLNERFKKYYYNLGRNDPCYCASGKKFKKCHGK